MNLAWISFWGLIASPVGFNTLFFSQLIAVLFAMLSVGLLTVVYGENEHIRKQAIPLFIMALLGEWLLGLIDWYVFAPPALLMIAYLWHKMKSNSGGQS